MNGKQMTILISALAVLALILWHDLPIEFPWIIFKVMMLFVKLFAVLAVTVVAYILTGERKKAS